MDYLSEAFSALANKHGGLTVSAREEALIVLARNEGCIDGRTVAHFLEWYEHYDIPKGRRIITR